MKKISLLIGILLTSFWGFSQEVNFSFTLTKPSTSTSSDGSITARISGVHEGTEVFCTQLDQQGGDQADMPIAELHYDFETEEFVAVVNDLSTADYKFKVLYNGEEYLETIHLATATQTNPLSISFTPVNQQGNNLGQITAVITTGSIEPNEVHCIGANNQVMPFSSSVYNAANNTLTVVANNLTAGNYTFQIDDGTHYLEGSTTVLYQVVSLATSFNATHVLNSSDAKVTATISGGTNSSVVTFNKHGNTTPISFTSSFDLATYTKTIVASGLDEGVYELHASENGFDVYSYVWVGKYGATTTLSVQPDANYGVDAYLSYLPRYPQMADENNGTYTANPNFQRVNGGHPFKGRTVIKFEYNGLEKSEVTQAKFEQYGKEYDNRGQGGGYANEVYVKRILSGYSWDENTVTWNTQPISTDTGRVIIPSYGTLNTNGNAQFTQSVFITDLVTEQLKTSVENNGFITGLMTENKYRSQFFYSSDYSDATKRPKLTLTFTLPEQKPYAVLKKKMEGGFTRLDNDRKLRFVYTQEYENQNGKLTYKIYNEKHELVMSDVLNTTLPASKRVDITNIKQGRNKVVLNIDCCLECGKYFTLEVTNEKNEKWYLRFKTDANDGSNGGTITSYPMGHPCSTIGS